MSGYLWIIAVLLPVCSHAAYLRCLPPARTTSSSAASNRIMKYDDDSNETLHREAESEESARGRRQKTFVRNPNYNSATKRFDKEAENMYIKTLPLPHPGALPGSTNGCLQFEVIKD